MGAGGVDIAALMHQLLRFKLPKVGQQVHLAGKGDLFWFNIGHQLSPLFWENRYIS